MLTITLYNADLVSPTRVEDLTQRIENLRFSTLLHGGFGHCTFDLVCSLGEVWEWRLKRYFYRLVIREVDTVIWEGRLEDIEFTLKGLRVTFLGYWRNLADEPYNASWGVSPTYADEIIKDMLTNKCPQIAADQSNIQSPGLDITPQTFDDDRYPIDLVRLLAEFSDSTQQVWYFAIWADRIPHFFPRNTSTVDWYVWLRNVDSIRLMASAKEFWSRVYSVYLSSGTKTRTATSTDSEAEAKYIKRVRAVTGLGEISAAAAESRRDMELEYRKEIQQQTDAFVVTAVYDDKGKSRDLWRVRAGDVVRIADLVPASTDLDAVSLDALRTFYIVETRYDAARARLTLVPDRESRRLAVSVAELLSR
jgi:hypothetical protein